MSLHPTDLSSYNVANEQRTGEQQSPSTAPPALELDGISLAFREKRSLLPVLQDVSLTVKPGEFVSLIGPSGSGKSTLFHIIGGLLKPQQGRIRMHGRDMTGERGHISYMPQQPALFRGVPRWTTYCLGRKMLHVKIQQYPLSTPVNASVAKKPCNGSNRLDLVNSPRRIHIRCLVECNSAQPFFAHCSAHRN